MSVPGILIRPARGRVLAGVCLAIANRFGWDVSVVRACTVIACLATGFGIVLYVAFWVAIPEGV